MKHVNPRYRYFVTEGRQAGSYSPWVVVDRETEAVVAEFKDRNNARETVKGLNASSVYGVPPGKTPA